MKKMYCLFSISSNTLYTTIQGCRPTDDHVLLENLRAHISMIKPSTPSYTMEILETDEGCNLTSTSREFLLKIRESLK
jgi:hypothetical protein